MGFFEIRSDCWMKMFYIVRKYIIGMASKGLKIKQINSV